MFQIGMAAKVIDVAKVTKDHLNPANQELL
jgi:hypothetical protein